MSTAKIIYEGGLRTRCTHIQSSSVITTDAPTDNFGKGEAFSPTDLLATSLVTCMLTTMGIAAQKQNIPFEKAEAEMEKIMASDPRRVAAIRIRMIILQAGLTDQQKKALEAAAINCPVAKSLHPDVEQHIEFQY